MSDESTARTVMLTFTHPAPEAAEEDFNNWYDQQHVPEILEHVNGVQAVRRYKLSSPPAPGSVDAPYLAVYEFDCPADAVMANFGAAQSKLTRSDTLGTGALAPITLLYDQIGADTL